MRNVLVIGLVAAGLFACSGSDDDDDTNAGPTTPLSPPVATGPTKDFVAIDAGAFCATVSACPSSNIDQAECLRTYEAVRVTAACKSTLEAITCDSPATVLDECFPTCDVSQAAICDGPNVQTCAVGGTRAQLYTFECNGICATQNATWTGVCGTRYESQEAFTVKCWCK